MGGNREFNWSAAERRLRHGVALTATSWWFGKRPTGWTLAQHLGNPTVNCVNDREKRLARAVAKLAAGPAPKETMNVLRFKLRLPDGNIIIGPVHGSGGVISRREQLRRAIRQALKGRDSGLYEPQPHFARCYPAYDVAGQGEPHDFDLRTVEIVGVVVRFKHKWGKKEWMAGMSRTQCVRCGIRKMTVIKDTGVRRGNMVLRRHVDAYAAPDSDRYDPERPECVEDPVNG